MCDFQLVNRLLFYRLVLLGITAVLLLVVPNVALAGSGVPSIALDGLWSVPSIALEGSGVFQVSDSVTDSVSDSVSDSGTVAGH